jgi:FlaA1/EpsC-like NDP-sugar epimerase
VAVVDDAPAHHGKLLHGVPIVGSVAQLAETVESYGAGELIIAIPSATAEQMRRIVDMCLAVRRPFRIAPDPNDALSGPGPWSLRVIQLGDLLGRPQVSLNVAQMRGELSGARVLVTGAAGSIGSELVHQLAKLQPAHLFLVDRNENELHYLRGDLAAKSPNVPFSILIDDVCDALRMRRVFARVRPTHVFHAAAFKHVPMMEEHPVSAAANNILGTWAVLEAAAATGVRKFVLISTDKAVEPSSVMGATKRFAEMLVSEGTGRVPMQGVIVRFGNVLGSNGSVVPLFQRQIAAGGPVTVTSLEATRYFMTTAEAAQLVLQTSSLEEATGKIAILDMGTPVRIAELAERLITLSGLRPGIDIEIIETGLRPGEKLHERLWWESEHATPSSHPKIQLSSAIPLTGTGESAVQLVAEITALVEREDAAALLGLLARTTGLHCANGDAPHTPALRAKPRVSHDRAAAVAARAV